MNDATRAAADAYKQLEKAIDAGADLRGADLRYVDFSSSPFTDAEIPPQFVAGEGSVDRIVSDAASEAAYKQLEKELAAALEELNAYRNGGLTEEILRRNDGCIKVGAGVSFVLTSEINPKLT
jgi:hypothetical protein